MAIDFQRIQAVFQAVAELPPAERMAVLERECGGDAELRHCVEALLKAHDDSGELPWPATRGTPPSSPLPQAPDDPGELPAAELGPTGAHVPAVEPGQLFAGRYKLREKLGQGGMGVVFVAEQTGPVQRRVALKVIRAGLDTHRLLARFEQERQALALMDHANIAKVFDAGVDPAGRPYFAMELVKGLPLTKFCDDAKLTPRQRLELFVPVCQAVQHAHQKGVIHRDLKPSNVLVGLYDGVPVPKVIDFGVAKATGPRLTEQSVYTEVGALIGTLEYMSPEQAEPNNLDIDTRSDVYALGVVLYELLTGAVPFSRKELEGAGLAEMLRVIKEVEPPKPSTKLSHSGSLPSVAAQRHTEPRKLTALVRGELDWIVMKALEKDRSRRYETANGFARDVQRYLADEPVQAGPPSAGYRLRKFVKRHRGPVLAAAVVLLALLAGIAATTASLVEARRQRDLKEEARKDAETKAEQAKEARDRARRLAAEEKAARNRADRQWLRAEWLLYASQITLAQRAWEDNNAALAFHYLESCRRDFRGWEHDYLFTLFNSSPHTTLRGHAASVNGVALSPDGKRVVSCGGDATVKVWDVATGRNTRTLKGHTGVIGKIVLSLDGRRIVTGSDDKTVKVWDADTGQDLWTLAGHTRAITGVAVSFDGKRVVSSSLDKTAKVWDADTGHNTRTFKGHTDAISGVALSPDGKRVVSSSLDKTVKVWEADTGKEILTLNDTAGVFSMALSPDGRRIVTGTADGTAKVWDVDTRQRTLTLKGHTDAITSIAVSFDGRRIVTGSVDMAVKIWDGDTGQELGTLKGHKHYVMGVALHPDGKRIVSGSGDKTVKVWGGTASRETTTLRPPAGEYIMALSRDGKPIVTGSHDGTARPWDPATGQVTLATTVKVWDAATGRVTMTLKGYANPFTSLTFSPDGKRMVTGSRDGTVQVWDPTTGRVTMSLKGQQCPVRTAALGPDHRRVVRISADGTVTVGDAAGATESRRLEGYEPSPRSEGYVKNLALTSDAKRVVGRTKDGAVKVWDVNTGREIRTLRGHTQEVSSVALSRDAKRIVTGSFDMTVKVWDAETGKEILTFKGHTSPVVHVALTPDGKRIVSGSYDQTIKVWEATTGYETLTLKGYLVVVTPDGKRIVCAGAGGTLKIWDASRSHPRP
jgi:WD40 repeat protein/tRNA A-37 threonylcarbamoyl transferase component Bud32